MATSIQTLEAIFDLSAVPVTVSHMDAQICYVNPAFESLTGFSTKELIGKQAQEMGDLGDQRDGFWEAVREGKSWEGTAVFATKTRGRIKMEAAVSPMWLPDTQERFLVGLIRRASALASDGLKALSRREMDVLELVAKGLSNRLIAEELGISHRTVGHHVSGILQKLDAPNRTVAVLRSGLSQKE